MKVSGHYLLKKRDALRPFLGPKAVKTALIIIPITGLGYCLHGRYGSTG